MMITISANMLVPSYRFACGERVGLETTAYSTVNAVRMPSW